MLLAFAALASAGENPENSSERVFELTQKVTVSLPDIPASGSVRVWVPLPQEAPGQEVRMLSVSPKHPYRLERDPEFGNKALFFEVVQGKAKVLEIRIKSRIVRRVQGSHSEDEKPLRVYQEPRGLLIVDDAVRSIAGRVAGGLNDPFQKAKALYQYVLSHMAYDKSVEGWGNGDVRRACIVGKGNCTDFHSLFIALALASGIPARFQMGFPVPEVRAGLIDGYHCWAEFYVPGKGWVPVDISEAWKNPERAQWYFGHLDEHRVLVSTGRDIRLSSLHRGHPLNYFIQPYAEMAGKPWFQISMKSWYKETTKKGETS